MARAARSHPAARLVTRGLVSDCRDPIFPIRKSANGRHLVGADGAPVFILSESAWSIAAQLTAAQVETYLDNRKAKGFNAIHMMSMTRSNSNNTPTYANRAGENPFTTMTNFAAPNEAYWDHVRFIVRAARLRQMFVLYWVDYLGYQGGSEGWTTETNAEVANDLRAFGRHQIRKIGPQENVIWVAGGDYSNGAAIDQQWYVFEGLREVDPNAMVSCHGGRGDEAYSVLINHLTGLNLLNGTYTGVTTGDAYSLAATAYARAGPIPVINIDAEYEGWNGKTATDTVRELNQSVHAGCLAGGMYGHATVCEFGAGVWGAAVGPAGVMSSYLETNGAIHAGHSANYYRAFDWYNLVPETGTAVVTSALGTFTGRVCPARTAARDKASIWTPNVAVTVDMSCITAASGLVSAQWFDPATGAYSTESGSPFANSGSRVFTPAGARMLKLTAVP